MQIRIHSTGVYVFALLKSLKLFFIFFKSEFYSIFLCARPLLPSQLVKEREIQLTHEHSIYKVR